MKNSIFKPGLFSKSKVFSNNNYSLKYRIYDNKKMHVFSLNKIGSDKNIFVFKNYLSSLINLAKEKKVKQIYFRTHIFYNHPNLKKNLNAEIVNPEGANSFFKKLKEKDIKRTIDLYDEYSFFKGRKYFLAGLNSKDKLVKIEIKENELPIYLIEI